MKDVQTSSATDPFVGRTLDEKYLVEERVGAGGMGAVYRARHLLMDRPVAIKFLHQRLVEDEAARVRFQTEARAAVKLCHPNAVSVTDFGHTAEGGVYIVMELLEGRTLREIVSREAPLETARATSIMLQASGAVAAAHEAGIIHRDLKPSNILVTQSADQPAVGRLVDQLDGIGRLGVAFSGGVDSATLLALAARALGPGNVVALLGVSPSLATDERAAAHDVARHIGVPVVEVVTREGDRPEYQANGPDRCFHCKDELFTTIDDEVAVRHRLDRIAYGENADDTRRPDRPGARAAVRHGVLRPLADAGLDKAAVRRIARVLALPCADKPAAPCLASRIPHHEPVTPAKLAQVDAAERALRALGFTDCRVRHHGDVARVELPVAELVRAVTDLREPVRRAVSGAGFRFVAVDVAGIQSGAFTLPLVTVGRD